MSEVKQSIFFSKLNFTFPSKFFMIAGSTIAQLIRNKRFYIVIIYFLLPVLGNILAVIVPSEPLETGRSQAVFHIHSALYNTYSTWWLSVFGQLFIVLLSSDLIASEFEKGTILTLKSRPVRDWEIFFGKLLGSVAIIFLMVFPSTIIIYCIQIAIYAPKDFAWVFWHSLDELLVSNLVVFLGILLLLAVAFFFSAIFNKALQAILISLLVIFSIELLNLIFSFASTVFSKLNIMYYLNRFLEPIFYNIRILDAPSSSIAAPLVSFLSIIVVLLGLGFLIFKRKEVY